ncbi:uncharacterized protein LOC103932137 [Pyrus x bretschneideri]|uniref:uncharacterized protein LOC103932137 n=1 Tax=Pyrus x bretschneideri TaxID=225117 RepID=UPI00202E2C50|nr:uncharacterized protein LOC103932137 [Pyrus x bretschneideri]
MVLWGFRFLFFWNFCLQLWKTFVLKQKLLLEFSSFYLRLCKLFINKIWKNIALQGVEGLLVGESSSVKILQGITIKLLEGLQHELKIQDHFGRDLDIEDTNFAPYFIV